MTIRVIEDLGAAERMALAMVRRLMRPEGRVCDSVLGLLPHGDLAGLRTVFGEALQVLSATKRAVLEIGIEGRRGVSEGEVYCLDAVGVAQVGDGAAVRGVLRALFPHGYALWPFGEAFSRLGACLAVAGYWMPDLEVQAPREPVVAPCSACGGCEGGSVELASFACLATLGRWREMDVGRMRVAAPVSPPARIGVIRADRF